MSDPVQGRMYLPRRVALRWRLDYVGRRPTFGAWSSNKVLAGPHVGRPGIAKASIEASDLLTGEIRVLATCPGYDWIGFRWIRLAGVSGAKLLDGSPQRIESVIHGMTIVTQLELAHVFIDGRVQLEPNRAWRKP